MLCETWSEAYEQVPFIVIMTVPAKLVPIVWVDLKVPQGDSMNTLELSLSTITHL